MSSRMSEPPEAPRDVFAAALEAGGLPHGFHAVTLNRTPQSDVYGFVTGAPWTVERSFKTNETLERIFRPWGRRLFRAFPCLSPTEITVNMASVEKPAPSSRLRPGTRTANARRRKLARADAEFAVFDATLAYLTLPVPAEAEIRFRWPSCRLTIDGSARLSLSALDVFEPEVVDRLRNGFADWITGVRTFTLQFETQLDSAHRRVGLIQRIKAARIRAERFSPGADREFAVTPEFWERTR